MGWPLASVLIALILAVAGSLRTFVWAQVEVAEAQLEHIRDEGDLADRLFVLERDVEALSANTPEVLN